MRILIVSDTHGYSKNLLDVLDKEGRIDAFVHCGDVEGQEDYIRQSLDCPCYMVAGNNDWFTDLRKEIECTIDDYRVFITHGNNYGVSMGYEYIRNEAKSRRANIAIFGHTHKPVIEECDNLVLLNPGSISYPRQIGRAPSYIMMEIDREHQAHFEIRYL